jgi:hypothetical protein
MQRVQLIAAPFFFEIPNLFPQHLELFVKPGFKEIFLTMR